MPVVLVEDRLRITRQTETFVVQRLTETTPAVVLLGPRQVGKTTLARRMADQWPTGSVYLDMERRRRTEL